ncbi:hypothetical protein ACH5RR_004942 [Cinchona calisaya]|uniref:Ubiquitin thioesterase OTU n=1 Tax=Cinchona calisaya TaxID=153742 RepID=A0ABD3AZF3_9GENT
MKNLLYQSSCSAPKCEYQRQRGVLVVAFKEKNRVRETGQRGWRIGLSAIESAFRPGFEFESATAEPSAQHPDQFEWHVFWIDALNVYRLCLEAILQQLRNGLAEFELTISPVPSVSSYGPSKSLPSTALAANTHRFFATIGPSIGGRSHSPALKKAQRFSVQKVTGDGRCLFRALVKGMAFNKGMALGPREERENADELRMAVKEVICDNDKERIHYQEALIAITVEESLNRYCQRIGRSDFWGGESELLVLSKLCCQPITVYIPGHEHSERGYGFIPIAEYGAQLSKGSRKEKPRKVVRLLYSGNNHYDLLV